MSYKPNYFSVGSDHGLGLPICRVNQYLDIAMNYTRPSWVQKGITNIEDKRIISEALDYRIVEGEPKYVVAGLDLGTAFIPIEDILREISFLALELNNKLHHSLFKVYRFQYTDIYDLSQYLFILKDYIATTPGNLVSMYVTIIRLIDIDELGRAVFEKITIEADECYEGEVNTFVNSIIGGPIKEAGNLHSANFSEINELYSSANIDIAVENQVSVLYVQDPLEEIINQRRSEPTPKFSRKSSLKTKNRRGNKGYPYSKRLVDFHSPPLPDSDSYSSSYNSDPSDSSSSDSSSSSSYDSGGSSYSSFD